MAISQETSLDLCRHVYYELCSVAGLQWEKCRHQEASPRVGRWQKKPSTQPMVLPLCPQYQELQASAQLQGDSMKEARVQISQLRQAIQRLQSQIASLRTQVGSLCLLLHPPRLGALIVSFPDGLIQACVGGSRELAGALGHFVVGTLETDLQVTSELTLLVPCELRPACWLSWGRALALYSPGGLLLTVSIQVDILLLSPWREGEFNSRFVSSFDSSPTSKQELKVKQ